MHPSKRIAGSEGDVLAGKKVVLGVCGSVAAVKAPGIARTLMRRGAEVVCVMSPGSEHFIGAGLMHWATGNDVIMGITGKTEHVELFGSKKGEDCEGCADLLLIAPATFGTVGRIANGMEHGAVDLMAACTLGAGIPVMIAPAMHESLYKNQMFSENVRKLEACGVKFVPPRLEGGKAKIAMPDEIAAFVGREIGKGAGALKGKRIVVTAGATREFIDGVRFISNPSTGRMGVEVAKKAWQMGAEVTLVAGHLDVEVPRYVKKLDAGTVEEMADAVKSCKAEAYVLAGAPGDFEVGGGVRKGKMDSKKAAELKLKPTPKIADSVKKWHPGAKLVVFKAESEAAGLEEKARKRMKECGADLAVANVVGGGRGFGEVKSEVLLIGRQGSKKVIGTKAEIAGALLAELAAYLGR
ncbi:MAG: bifunctional phosphopantothenoylcysteine decarboxylase/phosphopantothenate--cysteine ligase CoaBC [Candidatus Burarchaeum sp.]|nr:bifunctional phosphopantothenoylcysteine decarboxylase/phosphopantothenate--cysteine ligase CoaBC [Candidatus Burarchaeum sp.]MDO8340131.1 bifunctional phosphopantothenoylcysteine decarboxylase/phosphopantothenate--cysteine ligase CoaBC [Candidatus Burarchaeum sp.]